MNSPFIEIIEQDSRSIIDLSKISVVNMTRDYLWVDNLPIDDEDNIKDFIMAYSAYNNLDEELVRSILIEDSK